MTEFRIGDESFDSKEVIITCRECGKPFMDNEPNYSVIKEHLRNNHGLTYSSGRILGTFKIESVEVNTSYDQEQPIGDVPQAYYGAGAEPIDAKNGTGFLDVGRLGETSLKRKCPRPVIGGDGYCFGNGYCVGCGRDFNEGEWIESNEKLNKDGTGVARATRGIDPKNTPRRVLMFDYVSKSDCPICKPYDGKSFSIDSPNRPIIPRLESQGKKGKRPYTHPNCRCRWVKVFNEGHLTEVDKATMERARKWFGDEFDKLDSYNQKLVIIQMLRKSLGMEKATEGGRGSGKRGHAKWMLGAEIGDECPNCMFITDRENGTCVICGE